MHKDFCLGVAGGLPQNLVGMYEIEWGLKGLEGHSPTGQKKQQPAVCLLYVACAPFSVSPFQLGLPVSTLRQRVLWN